MTDRELLESAARAAGMIPSEFIGNQNFMDGVLDGWNPLADDGDALRLAVKLQIQITPRTDDKSEAAHTAYFVEQNNGDPYAATRRAITRAAAAIGEKAPT